MDDEHPYPRDGEDGGDSSGGGTGLDWVVAVVGAVVTIFAIASAIGLIVSQTSKSSATGTCTTSCWGFTKLECPTNRFMGACFGFWSCSSDSAHPCGSDARINPGKSGNATCLNAGLNPFRDRLGMADRGSGLAKTDSDVASLNAGRSNLVEKGNAVPSPGSRRRSKVRRKLRRVG